MCVPHTLGIWHKVCPIPKQNALHNHFTPMLNQIERFFSALMMSMTQLIRICIPFQFYFSIYIRNKKNHTAQKPKMTQTDARITFS